MFSFKSKYPGIFNLEFDKAADVAAYFLRFQEYYESPKFRGKSFDIIDYIRWYCTQSETGTFSYLQDWSGFNLPAQIVIECYEEIKQKSHYDDFMFNMAGIALRESPYDKAYLIGTSLENPQTMKHEVAHANFYLNEEYRNQMIKLVNSLSMEDRSHGEGFLRDLGYHESVFIDEIHAYSIDGTFDKVFEKKVLNKFTKVYDNLCLKENK